VITTQHIFGPVASRRLGRSLGVDLVTYKTCTLDCLYCECGYTTSLSIKRKEFYPTEEVLAELETTLPELSRRLDFVTYSGAGEPTLSIAIGMVTTKIKLLTSTPVALLTNGTLLYRQDVLNDITEIDVVIPSLDAADETTFKQLNRPHPEVDFQTYLNGLRNLKRIYKGKVWLEILLCKGINDSLEHLKLLKEEIERINPDAVQLNTVYRPGSSEAAIPLTDKELQAVAMELGITSQPLAQPLYETIKEEITSELKDRVLQVLMRRPCTIMDLAKGLSWSLSKLIPLIETLIRQKLVDTTTKDGYVFYFKR
jgi:wyosine [tRNA(Phe)-imidazoG37] synthetase (radical SAM superfamily)